MHKCIACSRADNRRYSQNRDVEARRAYMRQWHRNRRATNPDAFRDQWLRRYGITSAEYSAMLEAQHGLCAICGGPPKGRALHVDHCHATGKVRGLLCFTCNGALGHLGDSVEAIERVLEYLRR